MTKSQCIQSLKEQGYTLKALDENETKVLKNWKDDPTSDDVIENNYGLPDMNTWSDTPTNLNC